MISKKVLGVVMVGATLVVVGCSQKAAAPVTAPVETQKSAVVQPVVDASMIAYDGDTYTISYPKAWKYEFKADYGNADTFHGSQEDNLPMFVVGKSVDVDRGMCLKSTKKETATSASGLKFNLDYMVPDTAGDLCKDGFSYLKNPNFVQVNIVNDLKKEIYFTYGKSDEAASVVQLKAILDSVKKK
jgi:hypothetical protein